jgi:hypothetical protein
MTDKERRKKLLDQLRLAALYRGPEFSVCDKAADEIERLAATVFELKLTEDKKIAYQGDEIERLAMRAEKAESRINELLEFCEILRRERDAARNIMSGNVRLVEELDDGAIFVVGR